MKKLALWFLMFALLTAYSSQVIFHYGESGLKSAYASSSETSNISASSMQTGIVQNLVDRLTIVKDREDRRCEDMDGLAQQLHCRLAGGWATVLLSLSAHAS